MRAKCEDTYFGSTNEPLSDDAATLQNRRKRVFGTENNFENTEGEYEMQWIDVCSAVDIDSEDVMRFDHKGRTFAVYRNHQEEYFCTDGLCTHEEIHLADGFVEGNTIECPKHASIFIFTNGEVETPPACEDLQTYPTKVENGRVLIEV